MSVREQEGAGQIPELLEQEPRSRRAIAAPVGVLTPGTAAAPALERAARNELRRQIGRLERELGELFAAAFPRRGIDWTVAAGGGPRVLGVAELERIRDGLVVRISEAKAEIARRADSEEACRGLVERMIADPEDYHWVQVSNEDVGEHGCKHWHSRPRFGILGMLLGWWRVKLSSGCPLASGLG
jgi:PAS domain-containing protein